MYFFFLRSLRLRVVTVRTMVGRGIFLVKNGFLPGFYWVFGDCKRFDLVLQGFEWGSNSLKWVKHAFT